TSQHFVRYTNLPSSKGNILLVFKNLHFCMTAQIKITEPHVQQCFMAISQQVGAKAKHRGPYHF
ncbi:MAG TPA: hypothetical protein PKD90_15420, partial [Phnomibacter sp.]|nr:hypothetical protein [Phnomibacter sp.]